MWICPPCADEDGFDLWVVGEVGCEGFAHGVLVACEIEVVFSGRVVDEVVDFGERVGGDDVYGAEGVG